MKAKGSGLVWVVDDSSSFLDSMVDMLNSSGYRVESYNDSLNLLDELSRSRPDAIISDVVMPEMDGMSLLDEVNKLDNELPVILVTSFPEYQVTKRALSSRAFGFLEKPFSQEQLDMITGRATVYRKSVMERRKCHADLERTVQYRTEQLQNTLDKLETANIEAIHVLTRAAEYRHNETAEHIVRIGIYSHELARAMGLESEYCQNIQHASPMHDIGKIGICDEILMKGTALNDKEFADMMRHTTIGANMFHGCRSKMLKMAECIALSHHEKWDGSGYPNGLKGDSIPLSARIVTITDQYDALRSRRPYKSAASHKQVVDTLIKGDGRTMPSHFAPEVLNCFKKQQDVFGDIYNDMSAGD